MFKVLYAPFGEEVKDFDQHAHSLLVWQSHKGTRILVQNVSLHKERQEEVDYKFEITAEFLNDSPPYDALKEMLRSIVYTWQTAEAVHQERICRNKQFFYSFRGHGGSGVDGYW